MKRMSMTKIQTKSITTEQMAKIVKEETYLLIPQVGFLVTNKGIPLKQ